jgi:hypothetical protein
MALPRNRVFTPKFTFENRLFVSDEEKRFFFFIEVDTWRPLEERRPSTFCATCRVERRNETTKLNKGTMIFKPGINVEIL